MRQNRTLLALAGLAALVASCAPAPQLPPRPALPKVVSLNPCTDAILAEVADPDQVLAISHYSKDPHSSSLAPAVAARYRATRGSVEEVLALRPDLVLGTTYTEPASVNAYARLGLRLERIGIAGTVAQSRAQVRQIAMLVGHPERGEALVARIDHALARSAPPSGTPPVPAVMWQSGGLVPGPQALIVELMRQTGFANHAARQGLGQADRLSLEALLADPPKVLFVVGAGPGTGEGSDRSREHPALSNLGAPQRARIDPSLLFCGGPTIVHALDRLVQVRRTLTSAGDEA